MLYEVRILDSGGKIEKVVHEKELSQRFWKNFNNTPAKTGTGKPGRKSKKRISVLSNSSRTDF